MKQNDPKPSALMKEAIRLARRARGETSPNPMVGAVVTRRGRIVGTGWHRRAGGPHAEVFALDEAGPLAAGSTLHVTLEPCCHHGRTGPCTDRLIAAGIRRVFVASRDPNGPVNGKGIARLKRAGIEVIEGDGEAEARKLNEAYFLTIEKGRPWIDLKMAATADGAAADRSGSSRWITGEKARRRVHDLRWGADAVMAGVGTVLADDPRLTARKGARSREPIRVVLDGSLRTPPDSRLITAADPGRVRIVCRRSADRKREKVLVERGVTVWRLPARRRGGVSIEPLLRKLLHEGVNRVFVEGGPTVAGVFLSERFADRVHAFYAPLVLGGGLPLFDGAGEIPLSKAIRLVPERVRRWGDDLEWILRREG